MSRPVFEWLSQPAATAHVVLIHGGESTARKLEQALPGSRVVVVYREGLTSAYNEVTGVARDYPTVRALMAQYAPDWRPGQPLILLGYSAGGAALRYWLRSAQDREDVTAAIFLDSLYGAPGGVCNLTPYQGVVDYGRLATAEPSSKRLVMSYSHAHPAPEQCSIAIAAASGAPARPGGVWLRDSGDADHGAQQGVAGPDIVRELITPWIGGTTPAATRAGRGSSSVLLVLGAAAAFVLGFLIIRSTA